VGGLPHHDQYRGQVETEAIDVHLCRPIAQAIQDQPPHDGLVAVERVAAPRVVGIARFVPLQDVVEVVGQAAITKRRSIVGAFAGVVVDHVEDDFDAGPV